MHRMISRSLTTSFPLPCNGSFEWKALGLRDVFAHDVLQLCTLVESPNVGGGGGGVPALPPP